MLIAECQLPDYSSILVLVTLHKQRDNFYLQEKIDLIHEQVIRGDKNQVYKLLDKKGWANARDHYGHSALHKSVMANQGDIMKFLLHHHPEHIKDRDNVSFPKLYFL